MAKDKLTTEAREALYERTRGRCEWCGKPMAWFAMAAHHRLLRSAGGTWALSNLMGTHHGCHNVQPGSIHQEPKLAISRGAIVSRHSRLPPAEVSVVMPGGRSWYLEDDGTRRPAEDVSFT